MIYLGRFIFGMLFNYIFQLLELGMSNLANRQSLTASYIQKEINEINPQCEEKQPCIGFNYQEADQVEEFENENVIGFRN